MNSRKPVTENGMQNTQPNEPVYDQLGIEVRVGDIIAIGARIGNSGDLKVGTVTGFGTRNESVQPYMRKHEWMPGTNRWDPVNALPTVPFAVTVQVVYRDLDYKGQSQKGYVQAYDRKFVVVGEASA